MAGKRVEFEIAVDASDGIQGVKQFSKAVSTELNKVEDEFDDTATAGQKVAKALGNIADKMETELKASAKAAQALKTALGDIGDKSDTTQIVADLKRMGLTFEQIEADADALATSLKKIDAVQVDGAGVGRVADETDRARRSVDDLGKSADSSKSVLANMVGNASQDLGTLGGLAGSAGVALGQMGEYMADAAGSGEKFGSIVKSFAAVAGPIAVLAIALQAVQGLMAENARRAEEASQRVDTLGDAMAGAADDAVGLADALRENIDPLREFEDTARLPGVLQGMNDLAKSIPLVGMLAQDTATNLVDAFAAAEVSIYDFTTATTGSVEEANTFLATLYDQYKAGKISAKQYEAMTTAVVQYRDAAADAAKEQKLSNVGIKEANAIVKAAIPPLEQYGEAWGVIQDDLRDGAINSETTANAINFLADKLGIAREEIIAIAQAELDKTLEDSWEAAREAGRAFDEFSTAVAEGNRQVGDLDGTLSSVSDAFDDLNAVSALDFSAMAADTVQSFDDLKEALKEVKEIGKRPLVPTTVEDLRGLSDESAKVIDALGGMRDAIQTELVGALGTAGGDFDALRDKAKFFAEQIGPQFFDQFVAMGLGPEEAMGKVTELLDALGLLPDQVETQIKVSKDKEALRKIEIFGAALDGLPDEVQAEVVALVEEGKPQEAWQVMQDAIQAKGAVVVQTDVDDFAEAELKRIARAEYLATISTRVVLQNGWTMDRYGNVRPPGGGNISVNSLPPPAPTAPVATPFGPTQQSAVAPVSTSSVFNVVINTRASNGRDTVRELDRWARVNGGRRT